MIVPMWLSVGHAADEEPRRLQRSLALQHPLRVLYASAVPGRAQLAPLRPLAPPLHLLSFWVRMEEDAIVGGGRFVVRVQNVQEGSEPQMVRAPRCACPRRCVRR